MKSWCLIKNPGDDLTIVIDTREQRPFDITPNPIVRGTLRTGDYSIVGFENRIAVERKSLSDLLMCVGRERDRFDREIERLLSYEAKTIVVEAPWRVVIEPQHYTRSRIHPSSVIGSCLGWMAHGVPMIFAESRNEAAILTKRFLCLSAKRILAKSKACETAN